MKVFEESAQSVTINNIIYDNLIYLAKLTPLKPNGFLQTGTILIKRRILWWLILVYNLFHLSIKRHY